MPHHTPSERNGYGTLPPTGPHPSFIQLAKPYVFEQELQECMAAIGVTEVKEDTIRLQGVTWIDSVRQALQLPVRTYNTAVVYYHKFRLVHPDNEYDYRDAAAAALFNACKIEDTLKKSRDILCAAYNLKLPPSEHRSSDDPLFESHSKTIVGLERLMLEASGFDFRNRYPQKMLMKLVKSCSLDRDTVGSTAYNICLDLYRTFAPLKQTTQTMALSCLELAIRLNDIDINTVVTEHGFEYAKWGTTREEIMETLVDLLDLYTHHRLATLLGPEYPLDKFIAIRISLNHEASSKEFPRYTQWKGQQLKSTRDGEDSKKQVNGSSSKMTNGHTHSAASLSPQSPSSGSVGERGKEGTVRFMLDPGRAKDEKNIVKEYFEPPKEVEEEVEVEVPIETVPKRSVKRQVWAKACYPEGQAGRMPTIHDKNYVKSKLRSVNMQIEKLSEITAAAERKQARAKEVALEKISAGQKRKLEDRAAHQSDDQRYAPKDCGSSDDEHYSPSDFRVPPSFGANSTPPHYSRRNVNGSNETSPKSKPRVTGKTAKRRTARAQLESENPNNIPIAGRRPRSSFGRTRPGLPPTPPRSYSPGSKAPRSPPRPYSPHLRLTPPPAPPPSGAPDYDTGYSIRGAAARCSWDNRYLDYDDRRSAYGEYNY